jgi:hypothetical protein
MKNGGVEEVSEISNMRPQKVMKTCNFQQRSVEKEN